MNQLRRICFHNFYRCTQGIRHIHHIHISTLSNRADKFFTFSSRIININSIVCSTTTRRSYIRNQSRETYGTSIHSKTSKIIVTQQFTWNFCHTIHGLRTLYRVLRSFVFRSTRTKWADRARSKYCTLLFTSDFKRIEQSSKSDFPGKLRLVFCNGRKQCSQIVDCIYLILTYRIGNLLRVRNIHNSRRARFFQFPFRFSTRNITSHYITRIILSQKHCEFWTYLSSCSNY